MASIIHVKKKPWSAPVIRKLSDAEAEAARKLLIKQSESRKEASMPLR